MRVYIGYDVRDTRAFRACVTSLRDHASIPLEIVPLKDADLRRRGVYWRSYHVEPTGQMIDDRDGRPFSTAFSFTRFAIPLIDDSDEWALFVDADMLFRADVAGLLECADDSKAVMCVQHQHCPPESVKMDGVAQTRYWRKNWSSVMLLRPARCKITRYQLNNMPGSFLHGMCWAGHDDIGALPEQWNWLEGWSGPEVNPALVHYTRGTPDMLGDDLPFAAEWWDAVRRWTPEMGDYA